jgi:hypothetical protein
VVAASIGSAAALATIIQLPGISRFMGCTPLGPVAWTVVLTCSAAATVASAVLPRRLPQPTAERALAVAGLETDGNPFRVATQRTLSSGRAPEYA